MRPRGEVRQALAAAVERLVAAQGPVNARQVFRAVQMNEPGEVDLGWRIVAKTLENMETAGEIVSSGWQKDAHSLRWMKLYEPPTAADDDTPQPWGGIEAMASVMRDFTQPLTED